MKSKKLENKNRRDISKYKKREAEIVNSVIAIRKKMDDSR